MHETLFKKRKLLKRIRETHIRQHVNYNIWLNTYNETHFFELFRMQKATFYKLLHILLHITYYFKRSDTTHTEEV
jgi:hypothetical protein